MYGPQELDSELKLNALIFCSQYISSNTNRLKRQMFCWRIHLNICSFVTKRLSPVELDWESKSGRNLFADYNHILEFDFI